MHKTYSKVWELEKDTTFTFGHFTTISGHFFINYIFIFHKSQKQTVILRGYTCLNPNWIKIYDVNQKMSDKCVFQFWK